MSSALSDTSVQKNWSARLQLDYSVEEGRSVARFSHEGPLRILQSLYPEGHTICHNVLVHPPGGLVGGDILDMRVAVASGAHGLVTTPGATRFYRSQNGLAKQQVHARVAQGARLEWLPLEALAYSGCDALNSASFELDPMAELMTWDITALGLPHAQQPFEQGIFRQHLEIPHIWLERGTLDATDTRLMDGPLGLAGQRCMATLVFASGSALAQARADAALEVARTILEASSLSRQAGVTQPHPHIIVLRVLAPVVEPAALILRSVWAAWRQLLWQLPGVTPRLWNL